MKKNIKVSTLFYPMPVLIIGSYDEERKPNVMNAAWGGVHDTNMVHLCLSSDHKTTKNIKNTKCFTIAFATKSTMAESDYFGIASGNDGIDKIKTVGFTSYKSEKIDAPVINEYPLTLECKVSTFVEDENETTFITAEIIGILADDEILDEKGNVDASKLEPISFDSSNNSYRVVREIAGFAFKDGLKYLK